jgi:TPR repeat protein
MQRASSSSEFHHPKPKQCKTQIFAAIRRSELSIKHAHQTLIIPVLRLAAASGGCDAMLNITAHQTLIIPVLRLAAAGEDCDAMFNIGLCYLDGVQVEASPQTAFSWFNRSASGGQPDAMYSMAMCLQQGRGCMRVSRQILNPKP